MKLINQLEPDSLIENFQKNPPIDFNTQILADEIPLFIAKFDLLTTADTSFQYKIKKIPFYHWWRKFLQPTTCFIGTTVSEYSLFSSSTTAQSLVKLLKQQFVKSFSFLIVKDVPSASPLLQEQDNQYNIVLSKTLKSSGFIEVEGQALAWVPINHNNNEDYLSKLSSSRRKNLRRKLRSLEKLDIQEIETGDVRFNHQSTLEKYYQLYLNVYEQSEIHFDCLSFDFFKALLQDTKSKAKIITYSNNQELIGYNICYIKNGNLIDKYIGFQYPQARNFNLYFVSWFYNLDLAKQLGLKNYIAGWTDPEVKASLGAHFTLTKHYVYIRNPILRFFLRRMSKNFESDNQWLKSHSKKNDD